MSSTPYPSSEACRQKPLFIPIECINHVDRVLAKDHPAAEARRLTLLNVLVDTGVMRLGLPHDLVAELGLPLRERLVLRTSSGEFETGVYTDLEVRLLGRHTITECVGLPSGSQPMLGWLLCESLGLAPDLEGNTVRVLPDDTSESYWRA